MPEPNTGHTVRERQLALAKGSARAKSTNTGVNPFGQPINQTIYDSVAPWKISGTQITASESHPWPPKRGQKGDIGGSFSTTKRYVEGGQSTINDSHSSYTLNGPGDTPHILNRKTYSGPRFAVGPNANGHMPWPTDPASSEEELSELGATAVARSKPDNAIVSLSTTLGEVLLGGLPHLVGSSLWKDRVKASQAAGDEYLNLQFGWLPLVRDIDDFFSVVRNAQAVLKQYERDAGRVVRRRFDFPIIEERSETVTPDAQIWEPVSSNLRSNLGTRTTQSSITRRRWFSGAFTYHLPSGYDSRSALDRYALLADRLGLSVTPDNLWNLAPWSWAVDWFSNAGDVVSNVSSFSNDGTVMAYGYMMEHSIHRVTYTHKATHVNGGPFEVSPITLVTETKLRRQANPYGFGVTWSGLSPFQISILTALGLSRR